MLCGCLSGLRTQERSFGRRLYGALVGHGEDLYAAHMTHQTFELDTGLCGPPYGSVRLACRFENTSAIGPAWVVRGSVRSHTGPIGPNRATSPQEPPHRPGNLKGLTSLRYRYKVCQVKPQRY